CGLGLVAFSTCYTLPSDGDKRRGLAEARRLLAPAGLLVLESIVFPDTNQPVQGVDASIVELGRVVLTASRLDPAERSVIGQHIELTDGNVRLRPWVLRYALPSELDGMAERAGFRLESRWEDWAGTPFTDASTRQVVVYRRA